MQRDHVHVPGRVQALQHVVSGGTLGGDWLRVGDAAFDWLADLTRAGYTAYVGKKQRRAYTRTGNGRPDAAAVALPLMASLLRRPPSTAQVCGGLCDHGWWLMRCRLFISWGWQVTDMYARISRRGCEVASALLHV